MSIFKTTDLSLVNKLNRNTLMEVLGIECVEIGEDFLKVQMPVDHRTHQPMGLLHGGASAALIESLGSMGSALILDLEKEMPVGVEVNANHIGSVRKGTVTANGRLVHQGKKTHVWQVDIFDDNTDRMICTGRLTVMIVPRK